MSESPDQTPNVMSYAGNPAQRIGDSAPDCDVCEEALMFAMRDNFHEFSLPLSTVLECFRIAEQQGEVPELPMEWWRLLHRRFPSLDITE